MKGEQTVVVPARLASGLGIGHICIRVEDVVLSDGVVKGEEEVGEFGQLGRPGRGVEDDFLC